MYCPVTGSTMEPSCGSTVPPVTGSMSVSCKVTGSVTVISPVFGSGSGSGSVAVVPSAEHPEPGRIERLYADAQAVDGQTAQFFDSLRREVVRIGLKSDFSLRVDGVSVIENREKPFQQPCVERGGRTSAHVDGLNGRHQPALPQVTGTQPQFVRQSGHVSLLPFPEQRGIEVAINATAFAERYMKINSGHIYNKE